MSEYILELKNIVKTFGGVTALQDAQFQLKKGEVHALIGENGAGKSTLIKVITGVHQPDSGIMILDGDETSFQSTKDSQRLGIAAVYQQSTSFAHLSVTENIFMGQEKMTRFKTYNWSEMNKEARELLALLGSNIDVNKRMSSLSVAQQQMVEIAKALSREARIIIMDEPTSALTSSECKELYNVVKGLRDRGISIIFITHKFEDMYEVASHVTVFRDGGYVGSWGIEEISNSDLIEAMVGRKLDQLYPEKTAKLGEVVLEVENLSSLGYFNDISFNVRKGEILALTGLVGAGRTEVALTICGILNRSAGTIKMEGKELNIRNSNQALEHEIGLLPEDRHEQGLLDELPLYKNITAATLHKFIKRGALDTEKEKKVASELGAKLNLKARDILDFPTSLSGGNQQKVIFAKLLNCDLKVFILDEPTKGIDVGTKQSIYKIINELAESGYAIVMISSEMPEVLGLADRIVVMQSGRVTGMFDAKDATQEKILKASILQKNNISKEGA